jgi:hypothetical protein
MGRQEAMHRLQECIAKGQGITRWCERWRIDRSVTSRVLSSERYRVSVDWAISVERATGIPVQLWGSDDG